MGIAQIKVTSDKSGRNGTIRITGTLGEDSFPAQTFKLKRSNALVNVLLPGVENFAIPASGKYKAKGRRVQIAVETGGQDNRKLTLTLQFQPGGGVVALSGFVEFGGGADPVYFTVIGA